MNSRISVALLSSVAVLLIGCATDTGMYYENYQWVQFEDPLPSTIERKFELGGTKAAMPALPRIELCGRWRCYVDIDEGEAFLWGSPEKSGDQVKYLGHIVALWYQIECEFREDGTYSAWRVSKRNDSILKDTETRGHWRYENGVLSVTGYPKRIVAYAGNVRVYETGAKPLPVYDLGSIDGCVDLKLDWHSNREFTASYCDADGFAKRVNGLAATDNCCKGWYDGEGCFRTLLDREGFSRKLQVTSPMDFVKQ